MSLKYPRIQPLAPGCCRKPRTLLLLVAINLTMAAAGQYADRSLAMTGVRPPSAGGGANVDRPLLLPPERWEAELARAELLLTTFRNDSVIAIANRLLAAQQAHALLIRPLKLRTQLLRARAYERDRQDDKALTDLLRIEAESRTYQRWDIYTQTALALALLYEENERPEETRQYLQRARAILTRYGLTEHYPALANRLASYFRVFGISRDSAHYYAREAIRTAPREGLPLQEAIGHLLLGILLRDNDYAGAIRHYRQAGDIYQQLEDHTGFSYVNYGIARLHFQHGKLRLALTYSDTVIQAAQQAIAQGHEQHRTVGGAFRFRGEIYRALGQFDSAWHNQQRGYEAELALLEQDRRAKVAEIDARYDDERKARQLAEQARELRFERERQYWIAGIALLLLVFAAVLAYYFLRQRRTNANLAASLDQQKMLQGEIHHRVKNNLQIIISLLELQRTKIDDPATNRSLDEMASRIYSIAAVHEMLYRHEGGERVDVRAYIENLCRHAGGLSNPPPRFELDIAKQPLHLATLVPLGIMLNELLTNSIKYAARPDRRLTIGIQLQSTTAGYRLRYSDNGPGLPDGILAEREGGLGTYLLRSMSRQLGGQLQSRNEDGAVFEVGFQDRNG